MSHPSQKKSLNKHTNKQIKTKQYLQGDRDGGQAWRYKSTLLALEELRQGDQELKASLGVTISFCSQFVTSGKREPQLRDCFHRIGLGENMSGICVIDSGGSYSLWAVLPLGWWSWVV